MPVPWFAELARALVLVTLLGTPAVSFAGDADTRATTPEVTRVLVARLRASGRVEVKIERLALDPISGSTRAMRGVLALEPPHRADIVFPATGERITVRADGGEWLQPGLLQMIRLGAGNATGITRWWDLLIGSDPGEFVARQVSAKRWVVIAAAPGAVADSAWITLASDGLPARLEVAETPGARAMYRFREWAFLKPRGRDAFVIQPPPGYEVVRLTE